MKTLNPTKLRSAINYLNAWLDFNFENSRLPGISVAIQHGDELVYNKAFGYANLAKKEKLTTKHIFRIASHSKTFTATAIMQLVEAGKLHLDTKVSRYLPWFRSKEDERIAQVTIRQLLNHTAGVIRDGEDSDFWQILRNFPDEVELKQYIATARLVYAPDKTFKYSNFGFGYLGLVIEAISGQTYAAYVDERIIKPLELDATGPELDDKAESRLATGYGIELFNKPRRVFASIDTNALQAATGFYSNAEDLCRYFAAHFFGNTTLLSDNAKRMMQHGYWKQKGSDERYGLGMVAYHKKGWHLYGHSGGFPGYITNTQFDAEKQFISTVLVNAYDSPSKNINKHILNIIDTFQQDTPRNSKAIDMTRFEGRYYATWGPVDIIAVGTKLFAIELIHWNDFDDASELTAVDEKTLKIKDASGSDPVGELIHYHFAASKKDTTITFAGRTMYSYDTAKAKGWFS